MEQIALKTDNPERLATLLCRAASVLSVPLDFPPDNDVTDEHAQADAAQGEDQRLRGHAEESHR